MNGTIKNIAQINPLKKVNLFKMVCRNIVTKNNIRKESMAHLPNSIEK